MARFRDLLRSPFSFLGTRSTSEERMTAYVIREHRRGRSLSEILDDPYVRNRCSETQRNRLLDRPEVIHAIGEDAIASLRADMAGRS